MQRAKKGVEREIKRKLQRYIWGSFAYDGSIYTQRSKGASQTRKFKRAQRDIYIVESKLEKPIGMKKLVRRPAHNCPL
jgi:hypothetical protein